MGLAKTGALWIKTGKESGKKFMGGVLTCNGCGVEHDILVFKNDKDGVEKRPDYTINEEEKQEQIDPLDDDIPF